MFAQKQSVEIRAAALQRHVDTATSDLSNFYMMLARGKEAGGFCLSSAIYL